MIPSSLDRAAAREPAALAVDKLAVAVVVGATPVGKVIGQAASAAQSAAFAAKRAGQMVELAEPKLEETGCWKP